MMPALAAIGQVVDDLACLDTTLTAAVDHALHSAGRAVRLAIFSFTSVRRAFATRCASSQD
ncbi:hypothetical protein [Devosia pacifica]|uniref:hypothetical protein n=1 Tax=Devosia pacifica TaxID=1335967 RepID=UPI00357147BF